jgi:putative endonuclease
MKRSPLDLLRQAFARLGGAEQPVLEGARGVGQLGESAAVRALRRRGYAILERNFRTPAGEIDVIAEAGGVLCFIEVKWRRTAGLGHPAEAVTPEKQRRLARAAEWYLTRHDRRGSICRFDVVAILAAGDEEPVVEIYADAFRGPAPPRRRR